jgi:predicted 3-demethylubiquinone-9 3-methyltransferase (glyoxalase superfamily)
MGAITPFLWFDTEAEEAAKFYVSVFPNSKITGITHYPPGVPPHAPRDGQVMTVEFELDGNQFVALNGGPEPKFNHSVSFTVPCRTQAEIDHYWSALAGNGGQELACGWLTDRYGLAWQIVPDFVAEIPRSQAAMQVMMTMTKFDIAALRKALGK